MIVTNTDDALDERGSRAPDEDEQDWLRREQNEQDWLRARQEPLTQTL